MLHILIVAVAYVKAAPNDFVYDDVEEDNFSPAKYKFEYTIDDPTSNNYYGHAETRDGVITGGK